MSEALKKCSICKMEKEKTEFSPTGRGYLDSRCKPCNAARVKRRHEDNPWTQRNGDRERYWSNPDPHRKRCASNVIRRGADYAREKYWSGWREAILARNKLRAAVRKGILIRPEACDQCGGVGQRIEAHHRDYDKPLEVEWLCSRCHGKTRRKPLPNPEMVL